MLYNQKTVTVTTSDQVVYGGNMRRRKLMFSQNTSSVLFINFGRPAMDAGGNGAGFALLNSTNPLVVTTDSMGEAIREEIHVAGSAAGAVLTIHEFFDT